MVVMPPGVESGLLVLVKSLVLLMNVCGRSFSISDTSDEPLS